MKNKDIDIVDFHSHILPRADHGSSSVEMSLSQLSLAKSAGITRIIATPHFYPHRHTLENFISLRDSSYKALSSKINEEMPQIVLGAEVLVCPGFENFEGIEKLCIDGTDYMLVELPFSNFNEEYAYTVKKIMKKGINVVLAHVDRYPVKDIMLMSDFGVKYMQINADSVSGIFKNKNAMKWINDGRVFALGSDIHGEDKKAYVRFLKAKSTLADNITQVKSFNDEIWSCARKNYTCG